MNRSRFQFNLAMEAEDKEAIRKLKEEYNINVSGCIKAFLKQKLAEQEMIKKLKK